jgi:hypothetical protein
MRTVGKIRIRPPFWSPYGSGSSLSWPFWPLFITHTKRIDNMQQQKDLRGKIRSQHREQGPALEIQHGEIIVQKDKLREKDQRNLLWFNQGLGMFSDISARTG